MGLGVRVVCLMGYALFGCERDWLGAANVWEALSDGGVPEFFAACFGPVCGLYLDANFAVCVKCGPLRSL